MLSMALTRERSERQWVFRLCPREAAVLDASVVVVAGVVLDVELGDR